MLSTRNKTEKVTCS